MMLNVLTLTAVMVVSVTGCYEVTKAKIDLAVQQTGAQNLCMIKVKYYSSITDYVLDAVALEGEKYRGFPVTIPGTKFILEPADGASIPSSTEGEDFTVSVSSSDPLRYTGSKDGETIVGGVTVQNSGGEKVVVVAHFDSELNDDQIAQAASAVDAIINNL